MLYTLYSGEYGTPKKTNGRTHRPTHNQSHPYYLLLYNTFKKNASTLSWKNVDFHWDGDHARVWLDLLKMVQ